VVADGRFSFDQPGTLTKVKELLAGTGLAATVHAPYSDLNLASMNHPIWRNPSGRSASASRARPGSPTGSRSTRAMSPGGEAGPRAVWQQQKEALREIGSFARERGVTACLENMGGIREFLCRDPEEILG